MINKKIRPLSLVIIVALLTLIIVNVVTLAAFFSKSALDDTLQFGAIKINANNGSWFSSVDNVYSNLKPGDKLLAEDVTFNMDETSDALYLRVKLSFTTESTNEEVRRVATYLSEMNFSSNESCILSTSSDYAWSVNTNGYYYLTSTNKTTPLEVTEKRANDYVFITSANSILPTELEYNAELVNNDEIVMSITIQAVQSANLGVTSIAGLKTHFDNAFAV